MGKEMQRKGSKVLLCFWQRGQVREDLRRQKQPVRMEARAGGPGRNRKRELAAPQSVPVLGLEQLLDEGAGREGGRRPL